MVAKFLQLEWKQFSRSSYFAKSLGIKILMIFLFLYFSAIAVVMGGGFYYIVKDAVPDKDPLVFLSSYLIFWVLADLAIRFFWQQLPVMNIKPLMILPIQKKKVVHYLLGKSIFSFFNLYPLLFFVPLSGVLIYNSYSVLSVLVWLISVLIISLSLNFINFIINKNNTYFYSILGLIALASVANYYQLIDFNAVSASIFYPLYAQQWTVILPVLLLILVYTINYTYVFNQFSLDGVVGKKTAKVETKELNFLNRFGATAPFLKNDFRMVWRNVRPKQVLFTAVFFLFYGLFFFTQDFYPDKEWVTVFAGIFVTGGFLITFGAYVPSWDSEYYKLMMSQNIPYKQYLESKWLLICSGCIIASVLSIPYIYFGTKIYAIILAGAIFNIGMNSFITLYGGALNRVPIQLNVKAKAFENTQGFNLTQFLIGLPKMLLPIIVFLIPYYFFGLKAGLIGLAGTGVLGILLKNPIMKLIEKTYQKGKYKTIAAFSEK